MSVPIHNSSRDTSIIPIVFSDLIIGMKVDKEKDLFRKTKPEKQLNRAQYVKKNVEDRREQMGGERKDYRRKIDYSAKM